MKSALTALLCALTALIAPKAAAARPPRHCAGLLSPYRDLFQGAAMEQYLARRKAEGLRAVVLMAAGGGNDNFSVLPFSQYLGSQGLHTAAFGIVGFTPFHISEGAERPTFAPTATMERHLVLGPQGRRIRSSESRIPAILGELTHPLTSYGLVSPKFQPAAIARAVEREIDRLKDAHGLSDDGVELWVLDFGGDIFSNGSVTTISPGLDATVLRVARELRPTLRRHIAATWLGVDGELPPELLRMILQAHQGAEILRAELNPHGLWRGAFGEIFKTHMQDRLGNTIPLMNASIAADDMVEAVLRKGLRVGPVSVGQEFPVRLDPRLVRQFRLFDVEAVYQSNPFAHYEPGDLLGRYLHIEGVYDGADAAETHGYAPQRGSDFLMQYIRRNGATGAWDSTSLAPGEPVLQVLIAPRSLALTAEGRQRQDALITEGLALLRRGETQVALLRADQMPTGADLSGLLQATTPPYVVLGTPQSQDAWQEIAERVARAAANHQ